jgi:hypothetical protein
MKPDTTIYRGERTMPQRDTIVTVDGRALSTRLDLRNHSPTGFEWGYYGSGCAQLALAILADFLGQGPWDRHEIGSESPEVMLRYQDFKWEVIAKIQTDEWTLSGADVRGWLERKRKPNT